jgi:ABC-2 type transport system permease protein
VKDFILITQTRLQIIKNTLAKAHFLRLVSFAFVILAFFAGSYYLFFSIFRYLTTIELIGTAIMDRTVEMAFFVFLVMLLFSNVITSYSTFYNSRELDFLFSLPVRPTSIYISKLFENALYASLATMVLGLPLVVAYGVCSRAVFVYYPLAIAGVYIYLVIPAAAASILIFIVLALFPQLRPRNVIALSIFYIIAQIMLYLKISNPGLLKILETSSEKELLTFATNMATVGGNYIPSTWLTSMLKALKIGDPDGCFYFLLLLFVSLSMVIIAYYVARATYHQSWLSVGEHQGKHQKIRSLLSVYQDRSTRAFLYKDILTFIREPTQWVQLFVFVVLLVIYVFSLSRTPLYFNLPFWRTIISFANFAYISFVLATLGVRFIYPAMSLEHSGLWFLASSPFSFRRILKIKFLFNAILAVILSEGLLILSNAFIKTDPHLYVVMPLIQLLVACVLVSINLGLGSRFPQFNEDNPSRIAAGTGGIIAALISMAYVGTSIILLATPAYNYMAGKYLDRSVNYILIALSVFLFMVLTAAALIVPLRIGLRALEKRDF